MHRNPLEKHLEVSAEGLVFFKVAPVPLKVALADLCSNLKLYTEADIQLMIAAKLPEGRNKKATAQREGFIPNANFDVVHQEGKLYAIYRGKPAHSIGSGTYGHVKIAQDLLTGKWLGLKVIKIRAGGNEQEYAKALSDAARLLNQEELGLRKNSMFRASRLREVPTKNKLQFEVLMELAEGVNLYQFLNSNRKLAPARWLDLLISLAETLKDLNYRKNLIHGDLKLANFIFDAASGKVKLVDYGLAQALLPGQTEALNSKMAWGEATPYYMALECEQGSYSFKSEIFSLGIIFAQLLHFGDGVAESSSHFEMYPPGHPRLNKARELLPYQEQRVELYDLVLKMLEDLPQDRPDIDSVLIELHKARAQCLDLTSRLISVGYLDLPDFLDSTPEQQAALCQELKKYDEIFIMDQHLQEAKFYLSVRRTLEEQGIIVRDEFLQYSHPDQRAAMTALHMKLRQNLSRESFATSPVSPLVPPKAEAFYFLESRLYANGAAATLAPAAAPIPSSQPEPQSRRPSISVEPTLEEKLSVQGAYSISIFNSVSVEPDDYWDLCEEHVQNYLDGEIDRLRHRRPTKDLTALKIEKRIFLLTECKVQIKQLLQQQSLNFISLSKELNKLEKQLLSTNRYKRFFQEHLNLGSNSTRQEIKKLHSHLKRRINNQ